MAVAKTKTLIVAEKPSVGRELAAALPGSFRNHEGYLEGSGHVITWSFGHLLTLAEPEDYDADLKQWRLETLPVSPKPFKLKGPRGPGSGKRRSQLAVIRKLLLRADVGEVVNACDAGREGELIFAYLYQYAKARKPVRRLWLSSMTKDAIAAALADLRDGHEMAALEDAARSRAEADWLVGLNATRAATIRLGAGLGGLVSLGRVQTPTLAILARRELEIRNFKPEGYWLIDADFKTPIGAGRGWRGRWHAGEHLNSAAEAKKISAACAGQTARVSSVGEKVERDAAPLLYDLTALQREASTRFGLSAAATLAAAQGLYERERAITYPRSNSRWLPADQVPVLAAAATAVGANDPRLASFAAKVGAGTHEALSPQLARIVADARVSDHHAIIPTSQSVTLAGLKKAERDVYELICRRFLCVFFDPHVSRRVEIETVVTGRDDAEHSFTSAASVTLDAGWRAVDRGEVSERTGELPDLKEGESAEVVEITELERVTKPRARHSDATLLAAMQSCGRELEEDQREAIKEAGIGTAATRAATIERLIDVGYVERQKRSLAVNAKGLELLGLLGAHPLTSPALTGEWELRLGRIERGEETRSEFMESIAAFTDETVKELARLCPPRLAQATVGECPLCGRPVIAGERAYSCSTSAGDRGCPLVIWKSIAGLELPLESVRELLANGHTRMRLGGFKARSGKTFAARLRLVKDRDGGVSVRFDEPWARSRPKSAAKSVRRPRPARRPRTNPRSGSGKRRRAGAG